MALMQQILPHAAPQIKRVVGSGSAYWEPMKGAALQRPLGLIDEVELDRDARK